jgi:chromate reductase, NAD(P)H dehydrogenase (quinone)
MTQPNVLLVPGSLRSGSHTTRLLRAAGQLVPAPYTAEFVDQVRALPHYDADFDGEAALPIVVSTRAALDAAAALIISTPEYNGTIPGGLKNWVDWVTRPAKAHVLIGKPIAIVGAAPGSKGAIRAVTWLRDTLGFLGAVVVGDVVAVPDIVNVVDEDGSFVDEVAEQLQATVDALIAAIAAPAAAPR